MHNVSIDANQLVLNVVYPLEKVNGIWSWSWSCCCLLFNKLRTITIFVIVIVEMREELLLNGAQVGGECMEVGLEEGDGIIGGASAGLRHVFDWR